MSDYDIFSQYFECLDGYQGDGLSMIQNFTLLKSDMPHPNAFRFQKSYTTAFLSIIKKDGI